MKTLLLLYFFFLPLQLVSSMGYHCVTVCAVMALANFGTDAIASLVIDPFGTDQNDLPLDYFCEKLADDISDYISRLG